MSETIETIYVVVVTEDYDEGVSIAHAYHAFRNREAAEAFVAQSNSSSRISSEINETILHS